MDDEALAAELLARMDRDQRARIRQPPDWDEVAAVDAENTAWPASVLDQAGWPCMAGSGEQASAAAWLLAQHADAELQFQRRCPALLTETVTGGSRVEQPGLSHRPGSVRRGKAAAIRHPVLDQHRRHR